MKQIKKNLTKMATSIFERQMKVSLDVECNSKMAGPNYATGPDVN